MKHGESSCHRLEVENILKEKFNKIGVKIFMSFFRFQFDFQLLIVFPWNLIRPKWLNMALLETFKTIFKVQRVLGNLIRPSRRASTRQGIREASVNCFNNFSTSRNWNFLANSIAFLIKSQQKRRSNQRWIGHSTSSLWNLLSNLIESPLLCSSSSARLEENRFFICGSSENISMTNCFLIVARLPQLMLSIFIHRLLRAWVEIYIDKTWNWCH